MFAIGKWIRRLFRREPAGPVITFTFGEELEDLLPSEAIVIDYVLVEKTRGRIRWAAPNDTEPRLTTFTVPHGSPAINLMFDKRDGDWVVEHAG